MVRGLYLFLLAGLLPSAAVAADFVPQPPEVYSAAQLRGSVGVRYWFSQSSYRGIADVGAPLTTQGTSGHTAELTFTLTDTLNSAFMRGYVGGGRNVGGERLLDGRDSQELAATDLGYLTLDGGWELANLEMHNTRVKGFVGYQFLFDRLSIRTGTVNARVNKSWHAFRVGVGAQGELNERLGWSMDLAGVPWSYHETNRTMSTHTYGLEADAMLDFNVTPAWSLGVGGRYWWLRSKFGAESAERTNNYKRYGVLLESKYEF